MKTAAFAIALLLSGAAFAQTTTTTTQPDVDVDAHVGTQPDGDPDVDLDVDVGSKTKTTTVNPDGTAVTTSTSTTDGASDGPSDGTMTSDHVMAVNVTPPMNPVVQPSNAAPERDARGIPVISDPAVVTPGFNGTTGTGVGGPMVDPATGATVSGADASYPPCTRTVTDNCVQTYERGRKR